MPPAASTDEHHRQGTRTGHDEMGRDGSPLAVRCLRTCFPQQRRPFSLRIVLYRPAKASMLELEFLAEFVKCCLHLGECGIGVFERLLIVLLPAWEPQISDFQVT